MSEIVILYILCRYDATIYKISKIMGEMFFAFLKPSLGTINPAIKRLINLGCIEASDSMSKGGMASKTCSITPFGRKYLKNLLLSLEFTNSAHILNNTRIALFCADVLAGDEMEEFKKNIKNNLTLFCARSLEALENPYSGLSDVQIKNVNSKIEEAKKIMELV